jgi:DNA-directed RNA polymerase subunit RPC12/RpoP
MSFQVVVRWFCRRCEVEGQDLENEPSCWYCGGGVIVTARPTVWTDPSGSGS